MKLKVLDSSTWNHLTLETITILAWEQIASHLKMKIPTNYVCKEMTDVKLWLLNSNTWNYLKVCK